MAGKRHRAGLCACRKRCGVCHAQGCLLTVAEQDLIAGSADSRSMGLQAVENTENVVIQGKRVKKFVTKG